MQLFVQLSLLARSNPLGGFTVTTMLQPGLDLDQGVAGGGDGAFQLKVLSGSTGSYMSWPKSTT